MSDTSLEEKVREALREQADKQSFDPSSVRPTAKRARRRLQRDALFAAVFAVLAVAALIRLGVPFADTSTPATPPVRVGDEVITFVAGGAVKTIHADGTNEMTLASPCSKQPCHIWGLTWSPSASELAFAASSANGRKAIHIVRSDGTGLHALRGCPVGPPMWSPDASRIAVPHGGTAPLPDGEIARLQARFYTCVAQGGNVQRISRRTEWGPAMAWSPDGREVAYIDEGGRIVVESAEGTDAHAIARAAGGGPDPYNEIAWSPDGSRIAYTGWTGNSADDASAARLCVVNADGSDLHVVLEARAIWHPAWSPDSSRIVADVTTETSYLMLIAPDGTGETTLSAGASPTWDPSGTAIATILGHDIVLEPVDGSPVQFVVRSIRHLRDGVLAWRPSAP